MAENTFSSFFVTVFWDVLAFVACLFIFNFLRRLEQTKKIYAPKRFKEDLKYARPKELPPGYLGWVRPLLEYTEEDIIKTAGYDAVSYLRLFSFGVRLFAILAVFNLLVILPVNMTDDRVDTLQRIQAGNVSDEEAAALQESDETLGRDAEASINDFEDNESVDYKIGSFDKSSMTNIQPASSRLWAHLLSVWVITFVTLKLLLQYHHKAMDLRIRFLATTEKGVESHTVLVTDVPGLKYGSPLDRLMKSALFKFLPAKLQKRIEDSVEKLLSVATEGMAQMNDISTQMTRGVASQLRGRAKPKLRGIKNRNVMRIRSDSQSRDLFIEEKEVKLVNPEDVTDMKPVDWVTSKVKDKMSLEEIVALQFREVYPDGLVKCANVIYDTALLAKLLANYTKTFEQLEDLIDHYTMKIKDGIIDVKIAKKRLVPLIEGKWAVELYGVKPVEVDCLTYYVDKLQGLKLRILGEQNSERHEQMPAAFVTFSTRWAQTVATTAFHHHFPVFWNVQAAPNPEELIWENLKFRGWERFARLVAAWGGFALLCIFFSVPVAFVQGLIQMDRLENVPVLGPFVTFPLVNGLLKGIIPNLALRLFLMLLPGILKRMSIRQGLISLSEVDFEVVRKYFIFQTITVFFLSFVAGTVFNQIQQLKDDPGSIRDILGVAAPQAATFFISYILYSGLFEGGISFLNIVNLIMLQVKTRFAGTERAKARIWKDQTIEYGVEVPSHTLTILLGLAFSVINPIVLPAALMYFLAMKLMWTYNMMYICSEEYQSGGKLWEYMFEQIIAGLVIMQAMMMGLFAIKKFPYSVLLIPLPFLTIAFRTIVHRLYDKPLRLLSLRAAHDLDVADQESTEDEDNDEDSVDDKYKHPAFLIDWTELDALITNARLVSEAVKSLNGQLTKTQYLPYAKI